MTQLDAREGQAGLPGVSERPIVLLKPGNAGGGKGPRFKVNVEVAQSREIGHAPNTFTQGSEATGGEKGGGSIPDPFVRRAKAPIFSGCKSHPARGRSSR